MALLPFGRAATAAIPRLQKKVLPLHSTQRQLCFPAYQREPFLSSPKNVTKERLSWGAAATQQQETDVSAAPGGGAVVKTPLSAASPSLSLSLLESYRTTCGGASGFPNLRVSGDRLFSFLPSKEESLAIRRGGVPVRCGVSAVSSLSGYADVFFSPKRLQTSPRISSAAFTSCRTKNAAVCVSPAVPWISGNFAERQNSCTSFASFSSLADTPAPATPHPPHHLTAPFTGESGGGARTVTAAVPFPAACSSPAPVADAVISPSSLSAVFSSASPFSLRLLSFPRLRSLAAGSSTIPLHSATAASLLSVALPAFLPTGAAAAAAAPPRPVAAAAAPMPLSVPPAFAAAVAAGSSSSVFFFSAGTPVAANTSPLPPAPPAAAWLRKSRRLLGARTRRQREEQERKAEQQRNSQLTAAQYSSQSAYAPNNTHQPSAYHSGSTSYGQQQVPPAGAGTGLSLGWQLTIAFLSSIAFYIGFVMMMRLFGGHRVVAVHVDQYGRPVDPTTGQPRY